MKRTAKLPELLAPAGDMECLYAAVAAGADAIYVGGKRFGARAFAKNFDIDELRAAVNYCHLHGVRLYVTLNTLIEDREMAEAVEYAASLYRIGVDALIIADVGATAAIRRHLPDFELHASTQMTLHNTYGVNAAAKLGVSRAVVSRELSLGDIKSIVDNSPLEIEVFLHGALCVCHSGQCLFSSLVGGRSGNRGECAQPCRLPFGNRYPLSLKDLSLASHITELIDSGVASLKIEGRMKSPDYVYTVTSIYRSLIDSNRNATAAEADSLRRAFSRGGFTDGYFVGKTKVGMLGIRSEEDKLQSREIASGGFAPIRRPVRARAEFRLGKPSKLTLTDGTKSVTVEGMSAVKAESSPLTEENLRARLSKMGNTLLSLDPNDIDLAFDEGINLAPSAINALRREAAAAFESSDRECDFSGYVPLSEERGLTAPLLTAQFYSADAFLSAKKNREDLLSGIDISFVHLLSSDEAISSSDGIFMPPIIFDSEMAEIRAALDNLQKLGKMYALVSNISQISLVREYGLTPIGDFRLNITNGESREAYRTFGVDRVILSPELTLPRARDVGGSIITYGRIPLMITERCFIGENFGCESCGKSALTDRKGERFPMMREFSHRNLILNSLPSYMGDRADELLSHRLTSYHLLFTVEGEEEISRILSSHRSRRPLDHPVRRLGRR